MNNFYLTEQKLEIALEQIYPYTKIIHNKTIPETGARFRPDYYLPEHKIVVEFDGFRHYTSSKVQLADKEKDNILKQHGIKVIRIPYFVQLNHPEQTSLSFKETLWTNNFHNGFVSDIALLPADFNSIGNGLFLELLGSPNFTLKTKKEIVATLVYRCQKGKVDRVIPKDYFNNHNYITVSRGLSDYDLERAEKAILECNNR